MNKTHTITQLGAQRLRAVADAIELNPERFHYIEYLAEWDGRGELAPVDDEVEALRDFGQCGTAACIAGWAAADAVRHDPTLLEGHDDDGVVVEKIAADWLQISKTEGIPNPDDWFFSTDAHYLFHGHDATVEPFGYDEGFDALESMTGVEAAKMCRMIADGDHPRYTVVG